MICESGINKFDDFNFLFIPCVQVKADIHIGDGIVDQLKAFVLIAALCDCFIYLEHLHFPDIAVLFSFPIEGLSSFDKKTI